jgi:peptide/nickel transport system permease protein
MLKFALRRFAYSIALLVVASVCIFYALRLAPGNPVDVSVAFLRTDELRNLVAKEYGTDQPLLNQYVIFVKRMLTGDPGTSLISGASIAGIVKASGANTLRLGLTALVLVYAVSIPLGVIAAWRRNSLVDQGARFLAVLGMGIPSFFLAVLLLQLFALRLQWVPVAGAGGFHNSILPAIVLAVESIAINLRLMRSSMLEELGKEYITTLRAKGVTRARINGVHALRNALIPVVAFAGVIAPLIIGYTLIVEVIFRYEGLGYQLVQSISNRDYPLAQTLALLFTALVIFSNFLADVAHQFLDPKVRDRTSRAGT